VQSALTCGNRNRRVIAAVAIRGLVGLTSPPAVCPDLYHLFLPCECKYLAAVLAHSTDEETGTKSLEDAENAKYPGRANPLSGSERLR
jgi:hypothetical protein